MKKDPDIDALATQAKLDLPATLEEFALFPNLPIELRFRIWNMALPGPRNVYYNRGWLYLPVPSLLHVNTEARAEAKKHYILSPTERGNEMYIDAAIDTVHIFVIVNNKFVDKLVFAFENPHSTTFRYQHVVMFLGMWMVILLDRKYGAASARFFEDDVVQKAAAITSTCSWPFPNQVGTMSDNPLIDVRDLIRDELVLGRKEV